MVYPRWVAVLVALTLPVAAASTVAAVPSTCHVTATWQPLAWSLDISHDPDASFRTVTLRLDRSCPLDHVANVIFQTQRGRHPSRDTLLLRGSYPNTFTLVGVPWWWTPAVLSASGKATYPIPYTRGP